MNRRRFVIALAGSATVPLWLTHISTVRGGKTLDSNKIELSAAEWRNRLTPEQYHVLRDEGTERAGTSPLNDEKRDGTFICAGCDQALFHSSMKFDSGTGWPSFFDVIEGAVETKRDFKLIWPRTEYHCSRCGGHHGHVFNDGPKPTGLRYCNNGIAVAHLTTPSFVKCSHV